MRNLKAVVLEAMILAIAGLLFALAANALSPRGLRLGRNYFPGVSASQAATANATNTLETTLQKLGLNLARSNEVAQLFRDPAYEQGLIVFVDARNDHAYELGHVPGGWQLGRYRPEGYLPQVLPVCMAAQKV